MVALVSGWMGLLCQQAGAGAAVWVSPSGCVGGW